MTNDEITRMANQIWMAGEVYIGPSIDSLARFSAIVDAAARAEEREACAELAQKTICDTHIPTGIDIYGTRAAKAIRARGQA
jgi:hypothetical protein